MISRGWLAEPARAGFQQRARVRQLLYQGRASAQDVSIVDTVPFGRALVIDGAIQTTEKDEYIYHEMMVHVPLFTHPRAHRVVVIGGGDGGCLRRALAHPVKEVLMVELEPDVVEVCQRYLPAVGGLAWEDRRVSLEYADGARFMARRGEKADVILVDSTDPIGPAEALFSLAFYRDAFNALEADGILVTQSGSPFLMASELAETALKLRQVFPLVRVYLAPIPSYPGVLWSFCLASKTYDPLEVSQDHIESQCSRLNTDFEYYSPRVHRASFALPPFVAKLLEESCGRGEKSARHPISC